MFGPKTRARVRQYLAMRGLTASGIGSRPGDRGRVTVCVEVGGAWASDHISRQDWQARKPGGSPHQAPTELLWCGCQSRILVPTGRCAG